MVFNNDLFVFILFRTSSLVLRSFHDILNILLYNHFSKACRLPGVTLVSVYVSAPYNSVDLMLMLSVDLMLMLSVDLISIAPISPARLGPVA